MTLAVDRHLPLLHSLKQCGLGFWWCSIDLICKQNVGKDWATSQIEVRCRDIEDVSARNVGRHQIRSELYPAEGRIDYSRECFDSQSLRRTGHALNQRVALREKRDQDLFNRVVLTNDDFVQFVPYVGNS